MRSEGRPVRRTSGKAGSRPFAPGSAPRPASRPPRRRGARSHRLRLRPTPARRRRGGLRGGKPRAPRARTGGGDVSVKLHLARCAANAFVDVLAQAVLQLAQHRGSDAFHSAKVNASSPSSCASSRTATSIVFVVSPTSNGSGSGAGTRRPCAGSGGAALSYDQIRRATISRPRPPAPPAAGASRRKHFRRGDSNSAPPGAERVAMSVGYTGDAERAVG